MLESGKYDFVHKFFGKMQRSGLALKALTYKVLVRALWKEGKVDEAIEVVRNMERRGVVGTASVYYELSCCLCNSGRWKEAMLEVEKLKRLPLTKPLEVAFTGLLLSSMDGGHLLDCISIFEHMKDHCAPNIGTINAMLKVYGRSDMFVKAKDLFEATKRINSSFNTSLDANMPLTPDVYSYSSMLEVSASAHQWEYFEYLYKEMTLNGCHLEPEKHAWLLIQASRAGKWHLLEHAFDTILEAGEIPHISLFTEMICQTIVQENYERTVLLVNSMAHASMQVSEKQWTDLFKKSRDWISEDKLQRLLDVLNERNIVSEAPASNNLFNALQSICRLKTLPDHSTLIISNDIPVDNLALSENEEDVKSRRETPNYYLPTRTLINRDGVEQPIDDDSPVISVYHTDEEASADIHTKVEDSVQQVTSGLFSDCTDSSVDSASILHENSETSATEMALDLLTGHINFSSDPKLPSASEILETWRENRKKDGLSPFQL